MFWRLNRPGLLLVFLAASLVAGEVAGFAAPQMSSLWPWAACIAFNLLLASIGWSLRNLRWVVAAVAGLALAWHVEEERIAVERYSHSVSANGLPPTYELAVESGVARRRRQADGGWIVAFGSRIGDMPVKVVAKMDDGMLLPSRGERWRCGGWLSLKKNAVSRYARRTLWVMDGSHMERVAAAGRISANAAYQKISSVLSSYADVGLRWNPELSGLIKAMLLGRRCEVDASKRAVFAAAGTIHVFAVSGLHVMLVAGVICMLMAKAGLPMRARSALAIPALAAYVMMSGARPSAVRAACMAGLWFGAGLVGRKPDSLVALGATAIIVYGSSPAIVFDAGCALSFSVMLGILLWRRWSAQFAGPLDWMLKKAADEQSIGDSQRKLAFLAWRGRGMFVLGALGISFAAWIASAPIAARIFGRITVGGMFANVVVVPLAAASVSFGGVGMAASIVAPPIGALFNNLAAACIWAMAKVSEAVAACPGASIETRPWGVMDCGAWYVAWIALFAVLSRNLPRREAVAVSTW